MTQGSGAWPFPAGEEDNRIIRGMHNGQPFELELGNFPPDEPTFLDKINQLWRGKKEKFFAKVHSHVGGVFYKILKHDHEARFTGQLLHARWLREDEDDPPLDVGTVVVGGKDRRGRYCFQRTPLRYMNFDGICSLDEANPTVSNGFQSDVVNLGCTNDGTAGQEQRLLMHLRKPVVMPYDATSGQAGPQIGVRIKGDMDVTVTASPNQAVSWEYGFGYELRAVLSDFDPTTATWKWAYTDGSLTVDTDAATSWGYRKVGSGLSALMAIGGELDPTNDWTPGTGGVFSVNCQGWGAPGPYSWTGTSDWSAHTIYGVELRVVPAETYPVKGTGAGIDDMTWESTTWAFVPGSCVWLNPWYF